MEAWTKYLFRLAHCRSQLWLQQWEVRGENPLNADEQREVKRQLDEFDSNLMKIKKEVNADGVTLSTSGPFAGIRTALSIGYRF